MKSKNRNQKMQSAVILFFWSIPSVSMLEIYKRKSELLKKAMLENKTVEVLIKNNEILKLKKIEIEAGKFFGLSQIKGKVKKLLLNINEIKSITII